MRSYEHTILERAVTLHGQGAAAQAAALYREILQTNPRHIDALHLLGVTETQLGRARQGMALICESLQINPDQPVAIANRGNALLASNRPEEALADYDRALGLLPDYALAHLGRGNALFALGRVLEALTSLDRTLHFVPEFVDALNARGNALMKLGRLAEAVASYDRALLQNPAHVHSLVNRSAARTELEMYGAALADGERAIALAPRFPEGHFARGHALLMLKRAGEALKSFDRVLDLSPDHAEAFTGRGQALADLHQTDAAIAAYDEALRLNPGLAAALFSRSLALSSQSRFEEAVASFRRLMRIEPGYPHTLGHCLHAQLQICDWTDYGEAVGKIVAAVEQGGQAEFAGPFLALTDSPGAQLRWARRLAERHRAKEPPLWNGEVYAHDRIRVAYVSADFLEHPTSYLLAGVLERHDRERFETIGVSLRSDASSPMARRVRAALERVIDVGSRRDEEIARLMRDLEVDIAVDLMGYTAENRTNVFAYRPAPVQVNYLGFPATLGVPDIDYILADAFMIPEENRSDYSEQAVYLPECYQANDDRKLVAAGELTRLDMGLPASGFIWCSFHSTYKLTPSMFDVWARLLLAVPGSVLWMVGDKPAIERNLRREALARGVDPGRLIFARRLPYPTHLSRLRLADLCLDTLPYNGGATSSDALWAGVPIVTCAGRSYAARMSASLLRTLELPELVTHSLGDYERVALQLAQAPDRLAGLRDRLARNVATGPLFDAARFCRHLEAAFTAMVERSRRGEPAASMKIPAFSRVS